MACSDSVVESVRMYVMYPRSYRPWATRIVRWAFQRKRREASCWRVEVMKGA